MTYNLFIYQDAQSQAKSLAHLLFTQIMAAQAKGKPFLLGCPGGRSPFATYAHLGKLIAQEQADISHLVIVMMDDYVLKEGDILRQCDVDAHYSCRRFAKEHIQNCFNAGIPAEKHVHEVWFPPLDDPEAYDARLTAAGGIDHFILASGTTDGHVAFNPPHTPKDRLSHIATLSLETRTDNLGTFPEYKNIDEVPLYGLTVGLGTIKQQSKQISLIINGHHKKPAVKRLLSLKEFDSTWPVSIIYECENVSIYLDQTCNPLEIV